MDKDLYKNRRKAEKRFEKIFDKIDKLYSTTDSNFNFERVYDDKVIHKKLLVIKDKDLRKEFIHKWIASSEAGLKDYERFEKAITLPKKVNHAKEIKDCLMTASFAVGIYLVIDYFVGEGPLITGKVVLCFVLLFAFFYYQPIKASKVLTNEDMSHNKQVDTWFEKNTDTRDWIVRLKRQLDLIKD